MLSRLTVRNLAIVESVQAEFGDGLNVVTGETGAGKSVLMGALRLALGARADASVVRDGAKEAVVEAEFELGGRALAAAAAILEEAGLAPCEGGSLVVRRTISAAGGGRVRVNDGAATAQTLRALSRALVDVHGPADNLSLADPAFQRRLLDAYGRVDGSAYAREWRKLADLRRERAALEADSDEGVADEIERLRYAVDELDAAKLSSEDEDELPARHAAAAHAEDILDKSAAATSALSGDEGGSAVDALVAAGASLREMCRHYPDAEGWCGEVESLVVQAQELSRAIAEAVSRIDADPDEFQRLDERLSLVQRLKRKYRVSTVGELLAAAEVKTRRLAELEGRGARLEALAGEIAAAEAAVRAAGVGVTAARRKAATRLGGEVTKQLRALGFLRAGFTVELEPAEPDATGCDRVIFSFEPNPGEPARPLADIASSGEIARVMLAVKTVTAEHESIPVMVFDEIDSNVGGETGSVVGERLRAVAAKCQVIAITHLPQSAVWGERHLAVSKTVSGGRTRSSVNQLEGEARVAEIARMLGGTGLTSVVEAHARELLDRARPGKKRK